jgi:hypothetical protein
MCSVGWSLVRRTSWYDALRCIGHHSAAAPDLHVRVLTHLDAMLHSERYTQRPAYALALNAFKLQLLSSVSDACAQSVCKVLHQATTMTCAPDHVVCQQTLYQCSSKEARRKT